MAIQFPKIQLREYIFDEEFTTGGSLPDTIQLNKTNLVDGSEVVTNLDGSVIYENGTDYTMDYENGKITVLDTGAMSTNTTYKIDYEYVYNEQEIGADYGVEVSVWWDKIEKDRKVMQSGRVVSYIQGYRLKMRLRLLEVNNWVISEFLRVMYNWSYPGSRRIIAYPTFYSGEYEVEVDDKYGFNNPSGRWVVKGFDIVLTGVEIVSSIPTFLY